MAYLMLMDSCWEVKKKTEEEVTSEGFVREEKPWSFYTKERLVFILAMSTERNYIFRDTDMFYLMFF